MAFKKPLASLKTSAPLRSSDRRKLKQRVVDRFNLQPDEGDILVPEGLQSVKFTTHVDEPGVAYFSEGDPLWFTLGKGSEDLIPTVYTLWKAPDLLPTLSTPSAVIPRLTDGADLMIPGGVVTHSPTLRINELVGITQYEEGKRGPPLAVGRMAVNGEELRGRETKGKAVIVVHAWKDRLWEMGTKREPRESVSLPVEDEEEEEEEVTEDNEEVKEDVHDVVGEEATPPPPSTAPSETTAESEEAPSLPPLSPDETSTLLRLSLIHAIHTHLSHLPPTSFPIPSSTLYTTYILPSRPSHLPLPTSTPPTEIDIKHSSHKSLTGFLRQMDKEGLVKIKEVKGKGGVGEVLIMGVGKGHKDVLGHKGYVTLGDVEAKREKKEREREREEGGRKEIVVTELWKPHQASVRFFEEAGKDTSTLYTHAELKSLLNTYIMTKALMNPHKQEYINLASDDVLAAVLYPPPPQGKGGGKQAVGSESDAPEFMKREDALKRLVKSMQAWHRVEVEGKDPVTRKGEMKPIDVVVKMRQGRKACTLITNFEAFFLSADDLADELRKLCASATSVTPLQGKGAGLEVMVQGKQIKAVTELLVEKGVPKRWIEVRGLVGKKK
ncbi:hypothetical protein BD410DRAFT_783083 [Rickenella mellea]|uniref:Eukaryotic translation initiation factor SUI1 family protein n=1 Tax=Rickenella mellea TaxID=50990 RepID=A0A4Y7QJF4_9AGAM|nr:hypothetical protein BD410DRAFT_783083 [Rickenella mellea]